MKRVLSSVKNRLILGIIIMATGIGVGGGLIISAYAAYTKKEAGNTEIQTEVEKLIAKINEKLKF